MTVGGEVEYRGWRVHPEDMVKEPDEYEYKTQENQEKYCFGTFALPCELQDAGVTSGNEDAIRAQVPNNASELASAQAEIAQLKEEIRELEEEIKQFDDLLQKTRISISNLRDARNYATVRLAAVPMSDYGLPDGHWVVYQPGWSIGVFEKEVRLYRHSDKSTKTFLTLTF